MLGINDQHVCARHAGQALGLLPHLLMQFLALLLDARFALAILCFARKLAAAHPHLFAEFPAHNDLVNRSEDKSEGDEAVEQPKTSLLHRQRERSSIGQLNA